MVHPKLKNVFFGCLSIVLSTSISAVAGEFLVRLIFDPVDYLQATLVRDNVLGHRVEPNGHDAWGFRNKSVPASVKIVAIGDSQTYGIFTTARDSWPGKLQKLINQDVYNLSVGGYGPPQYYYLLKSKALKLNPSLIMAGFYFGNDVFDSYKFVYEIDYWKYLRRPDFVAAEKVESHIDDSPDSRPRKFMGPIRTWLAYNSVLYRMVIFSFGNVLRSIERKYDLSQLDSSITILEDEEHQIQTGFTPAVRLSVLNLEDPAVQEGLRLTLKFFHEMHDLCSKKGIDFVVVMIPTKESVFAEFIENNSKIRNSNVIKKLLANERQVRRVMKSYFDQHNISYVDVLPDLQAALPEKVLYPSSQDGHPIAEGNEVIAKAVEVFLMNREGNRAKAVVQ